MTTLELKIRCPGLPIDSRVNKGTLMDQAWFTYDQDVTAYGRTAWPWTCLRVLPHRHSSGCCRCFAKCPQMILCFISTCTLKKRLKLHVPLQGRPELLHSVKAQLRFAKIQGCRTAGGLSSSSQSFVVIWSWGGSLVRKISWNSLRQLCCRQYLVGSSSPYLQLRSQAAFA